MLNKNGITLISLIITIILLLILSAVSFNLIIGENGIIKQVTSSKQAFDVSSIIEKIRMDILSYQLKNGENITENDFEVIVSKYGTPVIKDKIVEKLIIDDEEYEISREQILGNIKISEDIYVNDSILYCWDWEQSLNANSSDFYSMCEELKITSVYFCFDKLNWTTYREDTISFISTLRQKDISVLALSGDPTWYINLNEIKTFTNTIINYNKTVSDNEKIIGIVLDIEPAGTDAWKTDEKATLEAYVETQKQIYAYAKNNSLLVIQCIPYWFEDVSYECLEDLIKDACDGISVMNYWKNSTIELIKNEMQLAETYNKYINSIAEFGAPNGDTTDANTFYNDGISAAKENWDNMKKVYTYSKFGTAYHDYTAINKMFGETYTIEIYLNKGDEKVPNTNIKVVNVNRPNVDFYKSTTISGGYAVFWLEYGKTYQVEVEGYGVVPVSSDLSTKEFSFLKNAGTYFAIDAYINEYTTYNAEIYFKDSNNSLITNKEVTITNINNESEVYKETITNGGYISLWLKHGATYKVQVEDYTVTSGNFKYDDSSVLYNAFDVICQ